MGAFHFITNWPCNLSKGVSAEGGPRSSDIKTLVKMNNRNLCDGLHDRALVQRAADSRLQQYFQDAEASLLLGVSVHCWQGWLDFRCAHVCTLHGER